MSSHQPESTTGTSAVTGSNFEKAAKNIVIDNFFMPKQKGKVSPNNSSGSGGNCSSIFSSNNFMDENSPPSGIDKDPKALAIIDDLIDSDCKATPDYKPSNQAQVQLTSFSALYTKADQQCSQEVRRIWAMPEESLNL